MAFKRILNTANHKYYTIRTTTTKAGRKGQVVGHWSPKKK